jgi:putative transposase
MARLRRIVLPGIPHHITQRGNRRERVFFEEGDYALYLDLLSDAAARSGVAIWAYCLMPNHVHIVAVPQDEDGLRRTFRYVHRHYAGYVNARMRVTGHLWQGRFRELGKLPHHLPRRRPADPHQYRDQRMRRPFGEARPQLRRCRPIAVEPSLDLAVATLA